MPFMPNILLGTRIIGLNKFWFLPLRINKMLKRTYRKSSSEGKSNDYTHIPVYKSQQII